MRRCGAGSIKRWKQTFKKSRVEQTFQRVVVRKAILDDPAYDHLRQRQHAVVKSTGRGAKPKLKEEKTPKRSVEEATKEYTSPHTAEGANARCR